MGIRCFEGLAYRLLAPVLGHGIARSGVQFRKKNMVNRAQLSALTLSCGLLATLSLADPGNHNSSRSNRGTVGEEDTVEYAISAAIPEDDDDIDSPISDKAECEKNGGVWLQIPGLPGFCLKYIEGDPGPPLEPEDIPDVDLDTPGWNGGSLDEIMTREKQLSAPATNGESDEKPTASWILYDRDEGRRNNDPIPGIDIIVDKDPEDEVSVDDAIEYALIAALLGDDFDIDSLETQQLLDELLFGGDLDAVLQHRIVGKRPGFAESGDDTVDVKSRAVHHNSTRSNRGISGGENHRIFDYGQAQLKQSNDKVVRKKPGRTTYSN